MMELEGRDNEPAAPSTASSKELKKLEGLKTRRLVCTKQIDRINEFLSDIAAETLVPEFEVRLEALECSFKAFQQLQTKVEEIDNKEASAKIDIRATYEEMYYKSRSKILHEIQSRNAALRTKNVVSVESKPSNQLKLPKLNIPIFSGEVTQWLSFYEIFNSLIHKNPTLSNVSKLHYLISSLSGQAARTVQSLEISEGNYEVALKLLIDNYDNKKLIATEHIKKIMNYPAIRKPSSNSLRQFCDEINSHLRALTTLGRPVSQWDDLLIQILIPKLDPATLAKWSEEGPTERMPSYQELSKFLTKRSQIINDDSSQASTQMHAKHNQNTRSKTFAIVQTNQNNKNNVKLNCLFCKKHGHHIFKCYQFLNLPLSQKQIFVSSNHLCFNCLKPDHDANNCHSSKCRKCNNLHHTLLHDDSVICDSSYTAQSSTTYTAGTSNSPAIPTNNIASTSIGLRPQIFEQSSQNYHIHHSAISDTPSFSKQGILATAIVFILNKHNSPVPCRALLDSASHVSLLTERFANLLGTKRKNTLVSINGIGQNPLTCKHQASLTIKSRINNFVESIDALIVSKISEFLPDSPINTSNWSIPSNINLADPLFAKPNRVDLLIGAEHFFGLLSIGQIKLGHQLPTLQNTVFGWVVSGSVAQRERNDNILCAHICSEVNDNSDIAVILKSFWEIENHESAEYPLTKGEQLCEEHFIKHVNRLTNGRIEVRLPFKQDPQSLGNSYATALRRFNALERKLNRNPELSLQYAAFMREYEQLSHMELVQSLHRDEPNYFIPHHCITKPDSSTTKLRVVFDASAKCDNGLSLNDILYVGPVVQPDLFSLLIKFRSHNYVFTADITKMYRQISLHRNDQAFHQILWRDNPNEEIKVYRLCTVTYGTASASYLATRALIYLADKERDKYSKGAAKLKTDFYVDDVLTGASTIEELEHIKRELIQILGSGGLELKKWCSNNSRILDGIPVEDREPFFQVKNNDVIKTLGVLWDPNVDTFFYKGDGIKNEKVSKRSVLADIARLYDPLGLINPIIVSAKIFLQRLWKENFNWDEALPQSYFQMWIKFRKGLSDLDKFSIERQVMWGDIKTVQLHAFSDSSEKAYGTCIYLRSIAHNGNVAVRLLCAKSKVAPVKKVCLPRLELCAAQMMVQLVKRVRAIFGDKFENVYYWTDSSIVIAWLSSESHHWQTFIANRVATIQNLSSIDQWHHVSTKMNPADIISRGASPDELHTSQLWFFGPKFLLLSPDEWPQSKFSDKIDEQYLERKQTKHNFSIQKDNDFLENMKYNKDYQKTLRITAYMLRFCNNTLSKHRHTSRLTGSLTAREIQSALSCIIKMVQRLQYASDIARLAQNMPISPRSHICSLSPFLDEKGILRVGGRIRNANIAYEYKHPALLPNNHVFTTALIKHKHEKHHHVGVQGLLSIIREQFWPVHAKPLIRRTISQCILCTRTRPHFQYPGMGNLPEYRVMPSRPFTNVGTDFCGPFMVHSRRRGTATTKAYVAVFICLSTKAVHLELVGDLTTSAFLGALRRFISRRGLCRTIYSDNATNYVGARNELRVLYDMFHNQQSASEIMKACLDDGIEWKNIPPRSPHFGGIWEAAVKSAKHHMKRLLHLAALTYEEFNTLIVQIECILNSRPLSPLSEDPNDIRPLTPGHFLAGTSLIALPEPDLCDKNISYLNRWQRVQWLMQQFWHRWKNEYLHTLQQRNKWRKDCPGFKLNDVVIIKDDNLPPLKWRLGRVIELHPGTDETVRVVTLKTATGCVKRAAANLCRLPVVEAPLVLQEGENV